MQLISNVKVYATQDGRTNEYEDGDLFSFCSINRKYRCVGCHKVINMNSNNNAIKKEIPKEKSMISIENSYDQVVCCHAGRMH